MRFPQVDMLFLLFIYYEAVVAQSYKGVAVTRWLWVRSPLQKMNYFLLFSFLRTATKEKARRCVPPPTNSAESSERSILTLGSLCLICCMRDIS